MLGITIESQDVEFGDRDRDEDLDLVDSVDSVDLVGWTLSSSTKSLGSGMWKWNFFRINPNDSWIGETMISSPPNKRISVSIMSTWGGQQGCDEKELRKKAA